MERSKVRLFVDRLHVESKEERIVRIIRGKTVKSLRRKGDERSGCRKCGLSGAPADQGERKKYGTSGTEKG